MKCKVCEEETKDDVWAMLGHIEKRGLQKIAEIDDVLKTSDSGALEKG